MGGAGEGVQARPPPPLAPPDPPSRPPLFNYVPVWVLKRRPIAPQVPRAHVRVDAQDSFHHDDYVITSMAVCGPTTIAYATDGGNIVVLSLLLVKAVGVIDCHDDPDVCPMPAAQMRVDTAHSVLAEARRWHLSVGVHQRHVAHQQRPQHHLFGGGGVSAQSSRSRSRGSEEERGEDRDALEGGGYPPPSRAPSLCPATVPLTASVSFHGICNRQ